MLLSVVQRGRRGRLLSPWSVRCKDRSVAAAKVISANSSIRQSPVFPAIACALVVALLAGGLPVFTGLVVTADSRPAFTLDICHPIGGAAPTVSSAEAPLIPTLSLAQMPQESGMLDELTIQPSSRMGDAPIPPPPQLRA